MDHIADYFVCSKLCHFAIYLYTVESGWCVTLVQHLLNNKYDITFGYKIQNYQGFSDDNITIYLENKGIITV